MKLPKLFIRTPKGRYMPYVLPDSDVSDTLFRRVNGKYIPCELRTGFEKLPEGVWVVTARPSFRTVTNGTYLREVFKLDKLCDIERFPIKELADMEKCAQWVLEHVSFRKDAHSVHDTVHDIVARVYEYHKLLKEDRLDESKGVGIG